MTREAAKAAGTKLEQAKTVPNKTITVGSRKAKLPATNPVFSAFLLDRDLGVDVFKLLFELLGIGLGDSFLDLGRAAFDQVLGLLQA